jgi:hypothetical protein
MSFNQDPRRHLLDWAPGSLREVEFLSDPIKCGSTKPQKASFSQIVDTGRYGVLGKLYEVWRYLNAACTENLDPLQWGISTKLYFK